MPFSQQDRLLNIEASVLPPDSTLLVEFSGEERINELYTFEIELLSENLALEAKALLGKQIAFSVTSGDQQRWFNGVISRFAAGRKLDREHRYYHVDVVPEHWLLHHRVDCRIFQHKTVPDIIREVLKAADLPSFEDKIQKPGPPREYCVQYNESDLAFISRLMEEEGIFYYFKHTRERHIMVLGDHSGAYVVCGVPHIYLRPRQGAADWLDAVQGWRQDSRFLPSKFAHKDYNFETPKDDLNTDQPNVHKLDRGGKWEVFDWPGHYPDKGRGREVAKRRIEAIEANFVEVNGEGAVRFFSAGAKFTIAEHDIEGEAGKGWVCVQVRHSAVDPSHTRTTSTAPSYDNRFTCIPDSVPLRPPRKTPRPIIHGVQSAIVCGPAGEEIYTDKYGRVRVQFYWDREGKFDEKSSCPVRVAQPWAGPKYGMTFTPRIGNEVLVQFVDGDPDQPFIVGSVFNAENMPHWGSNSSKTQSGLQSRSSKGGGEGDANLLRFEDEAGKEEIYFHAQKDFSRKVEHDDKLVVDNNSTHEIGVERKVSAGSLMEHTVGKVSPATITMTPTSITLKATKITIEASVLLELKGVTVDITATGPLTVKGLPIKIN